ncbi:MAG: mechanosensitive ion channel family protein [Planctomycetota bacterium]|nr:MAG: mechanosensitive ion channel family protein [Planctomycetota bacterium]
MPTALTTLAQAGADQGDGATPAGGAGPDAAGASHSLTETVRDLPGLVEQNIPLLVDFGLRLVGVVALLLIGLAVARWAQRLTTRALDRAKIDVTLSKFFGRLARWGVLILVGLAILGIFGIPTASFAVVLGAAGLAIGLAFQGTLSNFAAGVMLLIFRPFKVGDAVNIGGVTGIVDEIAIFTTSIDTFDNRRYIVPNSNIFGAVIENITFHEKRRVDVSVGTDYGADLQKTREVLEAAARGVAGRLPNEDVTVWLDSLGDSSINWQVRVWAPTSEFGAVKQALTRDVKDALDAAGIGIPFPQMDVHLDKPAA